MAYSIELTAEVDRELDKLDPQHSKRILKFLHERVAKLDDPRSIGQPLEKTLRQGVGGLWKAEEIPELGLESSDFDNRGNYALLFSIIFQLRPSPKMLSDAVPAC